MRDVIHVFLENTVGTIFGKDVTCREPIHRCDDYQPGAVVEVGRTGLKKFLMPCGLCAALPAIKQNANLPPENVKNKHKEEQNKSFIRPSELPIYVIEEPPNIAREKLCPDNDDCGPSYIEQSVSIVRKNVEDVYFTVIKYKTEAKAKFFDKVGIGRDHSEHLLEYLREESNFLPRMGAVGIGGISGLILGLRGGKFKKLFFTTTGALSVAAICYPHEARNSVVSAKHYTEIAYNFVKGVKPGDEPMKINWPEIPQVPTTFSEFSDLAAIAACHAARAAGSLYNKAKEAVSVYMESEPADDDSKKKEV